MMLIQKQKRGVSPVIATVLLIALAVSIGVLITTYITSFIDSETREDDVTCAINTNYIIDSAEYNKTGLNNTLLIKITNKNKESIYDFGVILNNGTTILNLEYTDPAIDQGGISSTNQLRREQSAFIKVNFTYLNMSYAFGNSLKTGDDIEVKVINEACPSVSASIRNVI